MATTYQLLSSNTLTSTAASVTFSSISQAYTDLVIKCMVRDTTAGSFNGSSLISTNGSATYSRTDIRGDGASVTSAAATAGSYFFPNRNTINSAGNTANAFSYIEIYVPNYTSTTAKQIGSFAINETDAITAYLFTTAGLQITTTPAISSITIAAASLFTSGSSFYIYGIKNS
jgi:hypothetical protein